MTQSTETVDAKRFPVLARLLATGIVRIERIPPYGAQYVGTATDGVIVAVGSVGDEKATERYLSANPSPDRW